MDLETLLSQVQSGEMDIGRANSGTGTARHRSTGWHFPPEMTDS